MDKEKIDHIASLLYADLEKGLTFAAAKSRLRAKGYTDNEITYSVYSLRTDKPISKGSEGINLKHLYEENPKLADDIAKSIADEVKNKKTEDFFPYDLHKYGSE
jgi:hypothetical protein